MSRMMITAIGGGRFKKTKKPSFRETMESAVDDLEDRVEGMERVAREARTSKPLGFEPVSTLNAGEGRRWEDRNKREAPKPSNGLSFPTPSTLDN